MRNPGILYSVLWNFLGTFMSRHTEFNGYWLFGFIVADATPLEVDLFQPARTGNTPADVAASLASRRFREQLDKAHFDRRRIHQARLGMVRSPEVRSEFIRSAAVPYAGEGCKREGYDVSFQVSAMLNAGEWVSAVRSTFVAPHDPALERQSALTS